VPIHNGCALVVSSVEYIIIGGGPAGLQAAYELGLHAKDYIILERSSSPGAFFNDFPRHKNLISINKVHTGYDDSELNLRWDWNSLLTKGQDVHLFKDYSEKYFPRTECIVDYLCDYAKKYSLNIETNAEVTSIQKSDVDEYFYIELKSGKRFSSKYLIVATGLHTPWIPDIPGIDTVDTYCDMSMDFTQYNGKRVLVIGKGNSAFETSDALVEHASMIHMCSPNSLNFAWSSHYVGHLRAVNNNFLDTYHLKSQNAVLDAEIKSIEKLPAGGYAVIFEYQHAENEVEEILYDVVIACTGFRFDTEMFVDQCKPNLCERNKFPMQKSNWESTNVERMYFAGTLMQQRDYRKYMSGFIHGFRYNVRTLINLLLEKNDHQKYPSSTLSLCENQLSGWVIDRINNTSALWQQPGFLADAFLVQPDGDSVAILEELPVDYIKNRWVDAESELYTLSLEYGPKKFDNPFNVSRIARDNIGKAEDSNFLHPIIRYYRSGELVSSHHVIENLFAEWQRPEHKEPMLAYFKANIADRAAIAS